MSDTPDFSVYRDVGDGDSFYDDSVSLAGNLKLLFEQVVRLPNPDIQLPIIIAYSLIPSALATVCPVLALLGGKGSGKSTAMKVISALHRQSIMSAATSPVAIRNHINQSRWEDVQGETREKNTLFLFDNVTAEAFKNELLYLYFLNGYDRQTDRVMISAGGQNNHTFRVFSPKVISTVHSFLSGVEFEELTRRCMVIKFKSLEQLTDKERGLTRPVPVETLDLALFKVKFDEFWKQKANLELYVSTKKKLRKQYTKGAIPNVFSSTKWAISVDLLVTGCVADLWDINSGLATLTRYWEWYESEGKPGLSPLQLLLGQAIREETAAIHTLNERYGEGSYSLEIEAKSIKKAVVDAAAKGQLDTEPRASVVADAMRSLGWTLKLSNNGILTWQLDN